MSSTIPPSGPRLLGDILASGLTSAAIAPLIAAAIEVDAMQARRLAGVWKEADEALANDVFDIEAAWEALRTTWSTTRALSERVATAMSEVKAERGLSRQELKDRLVEVDRAHGGPAAREELAERLRELIRAHERLPMVGTCTTCGHAILVQTD